MIFKILWILRGVLYKPLFGRFDLPSYIGRPTYIGKFKRIFIGKKVRIFPGARIEVLDRESSIVFEDNISIAQNLHIISGGNQELRISKNTTFSANVFVTNVDHEYRNIDIHIMEQEAISSNTSIGENCFVGYGVVIQAGTTLGKQCVVGSNSVLRGVYPDYSVIVGAPAKIVKRYNTSTQRWERTNGKGDFLDG